MQWAECEKKMMNNLRRKTENIRVAHYVKMYVSVWIQSNSPESREAGTAFYRKFSKQFPVSGNFFVTFSPESVTIRITDWSESIRKKVSKYETE